MSGVQLKKVQKVSIRTTSVTLGERQQRFIERVLKSGYYTSASEVVRDALRKLENHMDWDQTHHRVIESSQEKGGSQCGSVDADPVDWPV